MSQLISSLYCFERKKKAAALIGVEKFFAIKISFSRQ
jgi:hypothetical protein